MLKWLKQKPTSDSSISDDTTLISDYVTDDPLATIQVNPTASKNCKSPKSNETYAVSRVNPLFKEERREAAVERTLGNISPSSGYSSSQCDYDPAKDTRHKGSRDVAQNSLDNPALFDKGNSCLQHRTAIIGPCGTPILHVIEKNPDYVKSIALAVPPPQRPSIGCGESSRDMLGIAKLMHKDTRFVKSIRIDKESEKDEIWRPEFKKAGSGRKQSVTFAENVDVVDVSVVTGTFVQEEQDSIVTPSLLLMTKRSQDDVDSLQNYHCPHPGYFLEDVQMGENESEKRRCSVGHEKESSISSCEDYDNRKQDEEKCLDALSHSICSQKRSSGRRIPKYAKSPFGGIADHYAAAKEIAKEIESFSKDSKTKTAHRKSLVRDLLKSGRNRLAKKGFSRNAFLSPSKPYNQSSSSLSRESDGPKVSPDDQTTLLENYDCQELEDNFPLGSARSTANDLAKCDRSKLEKINNSSESGRAADVKCADERSVNSEGLSKKDDVELSSEMEGIETEDMEEGKEERGDEGQDHAVVSIQCQSNYQQVPIYDVLPNPLRVPSDDSDSGNSSERGFQEIRLEVEQGSGDVVMSSPKNSSSSRLSTSSCSSSGHGSDGEAHGSNHDNIPFTSTTASSSRSKYEKLQNIGDGMTDGIDSIHKSDHKKVMIVTGDRGNMVVDLSGVPHDLRDAILSGTALITLPEGFNKLLQPGYAMINIPSHMENCENDKLTLSHQSGSYYAKNSRPLVPNEFVSTKKGALLEEGKANAKSKSSAATKEKRVTTIFPFHPNQDTYTSPDFTLEAQKMATQMRKVETGKRRRCVCRFFGVLFFLTTFLGILVALSMIYTRGRRYFGA